MKKMDIREKISTVWIVVMFAMLYNDIMGFIEPGALEEMMNSGVGFELTPTILLVFSIVLTLPILMIFFTRVLERKPNRIANIVVAILTILFVIGGGDTRITYVFFAAVEVIFMLYIIKLAVKWPEEV